MRDSDAVKIAKLQFTRDMTGEVFDLLKTPVGMMIGGIVTTNALEKTGIVDANWAGKIRGVVTATAILNAAVPAARVIAPWVIPAAAGSAGAAAVSGSARAAAGKIIKAPIKGTQSQAAEIARITAAGGTVTLLPPTPSGKSITKIQSARGAGKFTAVFDPRNWF